MFDNIKNKIQENKNMKKEIEDKNIAFKQNCKSNKTMVEIRQSESHQTMKCPLCQGEKFFENIRIAYTNYGGRTCSTYLSIDKEEGLYTSDEFYDGRIPINIYVCKTCGYVIQKMNFSCLNDFSFRNADCEYTLTPPVEWNN